MVLLRFHDGSPYVFPMSSFWLPEIFLIVSLICVFQKFAASVWGAFAVLLWFHDGSLYVFPMCSLGFPYMFLIVSLIRVSEIVQQV